MDYEDIAAFTCFCRNEKIRTYNFLQDRVTDHRVKLTTNGIDRFMSGGEDFEGFLRDLITIDRREQLNRLLNSMEETSEK